MIPVIPIPTPMAAVSSGMPAAISDPKVIVNTSRAARMPMTSLAPPPLVCGAASPLSPTCSPSARACAAAVATIWRCVSVSSACDVTNRMSA